MNSVEDDVTKQNHQAQTNQGSCIGSSHTSLSKTNSSSSIKSPQKSPSKSRKPVRQEDSENVSPVKLKRMLNSAESPVSPKRPCLTNLDSNCHQANLSSVRISLFADDKLQDNDHAQQSTDKPVPVWKSHETDVRFDADTKTECDAQEYSAACSQVETGETCRASYITPSKEKRCGAENVLYKEALNSPKEQNTEDADFNSPTRNLPNLVMDEPQLYVSTTPKSGRNKRHNWLTQIRLEKMKKSSQIVPVPTSQGKLSPKVTKGMRKINSYFK
ncbi:unnamed protein product [Candidula unifasciata]|uniref:Uncharacterized protein n=1 Tax=Candidula unifasciata TaxID=100452 RepID=A0A8S3YMZ2_9EUPU|nr:unnamed protein product [Candidula unifasciata]